VDHPAFDPDRHALSHAGGHRLAGTGENPTEGLAGNPHPPRGIDLWHALDVRQAQCLELVEWKNPFLKVAQRNASGFEENNTRKIGDTAGTVRTGHGVKLKQARPNPQAARCPMIRRLKESD
jgi:hypothetical protein